MAAPKKGSYAETRMTELADQRKQYNVNHLGLYRGGVPVKGRGSIRGGAIGRPGEFHSPKIHNELEFYHPDAKTVTSEDAVKFKAYMVHDKFDFNRTMPSAPMYYDRKMLFTKDRSFWLAMCFAILGAMYGHKFIIRET